jgi:hypothetical protein
MNPRTIAVALALVATAGCASSFQTASLVGEGKTSVSAALVRAQVNDSSSDTGSSESDWSGDIQVRHGVTDQVEVGARYATSNGAHYLAFDPKFAVLPGKVAVGVPIAVLFSDNGRMLDYGGLVVTPTIYVGSPLTPNRAEIVFAPKLVMVFPDGGDSDTRIGLSAGARLSSDLRKWALLPEVSFLDLPGGSVLSAGLAVQASY